MFNMICVVVNLDCQLDWSGRFLVLNPGCVCQSEYFKKWLDHGGHKCTDSFVHWWIQIFNRPLSGGKTVESGGACLGEVVDHSELS